MVFPSRVLFAVWHVQVVYNIRKIRYSTEQSFWALSNNGMEIDDLKALDYESKGSEWEWNTNHLHVVGVY